jgi:type II secretory pathway component GspD/PulD (secretin)
MIHTKHVFLSTFALSTLALLPTTTLQGQASGVNTERYKPAPQGLTPPTAGDANISDVPRYFLDTIDSLNRFADDESRKAPGLSKNNYIGKIYPVYNTQAIEIQSYLLRTLAFEGGTAEVMGLQSVKDAQGRNVQYLFVTAPDFMIPGITEIVSTCDVPGFKFYDATGMDFGGGSGAIAYKGKHRTASELRNILAATELGNVGAFLFPPFADDSTNTIYIVENPTDIADDLAALSLFDTPPLQAELDVTIYEVSGGDDGTLGLDWEAWKRSLSGEFQYSSVSDQTFFDDNNDAYNTLLTLDAGALASFLNYTVRTGNSKVVTSTKLTMTNSEDVPGGLSGGNRGTATGEPARIESTRAIPFGNVNINGEGEFTDVAFEGVVVEFLSFIGTESLTIDIDVAVNSLVGFSEETNTPIITERSLNTMVNLKSGESIALGGVEKTSIVKDTVGIPLLKEIPFVGQYLFAKTSESTQNSKVIMILTPTIKKADDSEIGPRLAETGWVKGFTTVNQ